MTSFGCNRCECFVIDSCFAEESMPCLVDDSQQYYLDESLNRMDGEGFAEVEKLTGSPHQATECFSLWSTDGLLRGSTTRPRRRWSA